MYTLWLGDADNTGEWDWSLSTSSCGDDSWLPMSPRIFCSSLCLGERDDNGEIARSLFLASFMLRRDWDVGVAVRAILDCGLTPTAPGERD